MTVKVRALWSSLALAVAAAAPATAWGQVDAEEPPIGDEPADPPQPEVPPEPPPPPPPPEPREAPPGEEPSSGRPAGFAIGIGFGWDLPADVDRVDAVSVRFRLASGLTFEPRLNLSTTSQSQEFGGVDSESSTSEAGVAAEVRYPLGTRGPLDLVALGAASLDYTSQDPDGANNDRSTVAIGVSWGFAIEYWVTRRWALSLNASNPLLMVVSTTEEEVGAPDSKSSTVSVGAIFDPNVVVMVHLFY